MLGVVVLVGFQVPAGGECAGLLERAVDGEAELFGVVGEVDKHRRDSRPGGGGHGRTTLARALIRASGSDGDGQPATGGISLVLPVERVADIDAKLDLVEQPSVTDGALCLGDAVHVVLRPGVLRGIPTLPPSIANSQYLAANRGQDHAFVVRSRSAARILPFCHALHLSGLQVKQGRHSTSSSGRPVFASTFTSPVLKSTTSRVTGTKPGCMPASPPPAPPGPHSGQVLPSSRSCWPNRACSARMPCAALRARTSSASGSRTDSGSAFIVAPAQAARAAVVAPARWWRTGGGGAGVSTCRCPGTARGSWPCWCWRGSRTTRSSSRRAPQPRATTARRCPRRGSAPRSRRPPTRAPGRAGRRAAARWWRSTASTRPRG